MAAFGVINIEPFIYFFLNSQCYKKKMGVGYQPLTSSIHKVSQWFLTVRKRCGLVGFKKNIEYDKLLEYHIAINCK